MSAPHTIAVRLVRRAGRLFPPSAWRQAGSTVRHLRSWAGGTAPAAGRTPITYRTLLSGALEAGPRGCVVFLCPGQDPFGDDARASARTAPDGTAPDRTAARGTPPDGTAPDRAAATGPDTDAWRAACGLARHVVPFGFGAVIRPQARWEDPLPATTRAVVALSPRFDPGTIPGPITCIGWALDEPDGWVRHPRLALFDLILAASEVLASRLRALTDGPVQVFEAAADEIAPTSSRPEPVSALVIATSVIRAAGIVPPAVFETIAGGRVPVVDSRLGLVDVGLADLPVARTSRERSALLVQLGADRSGTRQLLDDLLRTVRHRHTYQARARRLTTLLDAPPVPPAATVSFFPDFRVTNPYQDMLYLRLGGDGVRLAPLQDVTRCVAARDNGGDLTGHLLHLHWTSAIVQVARTEQEAAERLHRFCQRVIDLRRRGGRMVWTVHNVLPHELTYRDLELQLRRFLAEQADLVHVMGPQTVEATRPYYPLDPERLAVVPHSSYTGIYPQVVSREAAREQLGVADGEIALLALGGIRPYRGLDQLLDLFDRLHVADPRLRLLVAGKPGQFPGLAGWKSRCESHPRIVSRFTASARGAVAGLARRRRPGRAAVPGDPQLRGVQARRDLRAADRGPARRLSARNARPGLHVRLRSRRPRLAGDGDPEWRIAGRGPGERRGGFPGGRGRGAGLPAAPHGRGLRRRAAPAADTTASGQPQRRGHLTAATLPPDLRPPPAPSRTPLLPPPAPRSRPLPHPPPAPSCPSPCPARSPCLRSPSSLTSTRVVWSHHMSSATSPNSPAPLTGWSWSARATSRRQPEPPWRPSVNSSSARTWATTSPAGRRGWTTSATGTPSTG